MSIPEEDKVLEVKIAKLGAENFGKEVLIKGIVASSVAVKNVIIKACFICKKCGKATLIDQDNDEQIIEPEVCSGGKCKSRRFKGIDKQNSKFDDYQELYVQERQVDMSAGRTPKNVKIKVLGKLTNKVKAGDRVEITGELLTQQDKRSSLTFTPYILAKEITRLNKIPEDLEVTDEEKKKIEEFSKHPFIHNIIKTSIAPHIVRREALKEAIMYSLFGGVHREQRGDIHVLFIGDPSTGRSELLKFTAKIAPWGIYTSGRGSTAAGLTAAVIPDKRGVYRIHGGALVQADTGVLCIDEIDKMEKNDVRTIHTAMEQQILPIWKANLHTTLNTRTTIIAACNPLYGYFDSTKTIADNIQLDDALLTRFDLVFITRDIPEEKADDEVIKSILDIEKQTDKNLPVMEETFLKKYILFSRRINPKLSKGAKMLLDDYSQDQRRNGETDETNVRFTFRQVYGLRRLTEAHARIALKEVADEVDATAAIEIMGKSLNQVGLANTMKSKQYRDVCNRIKTLIGMGTDTHKLLVETLHDEGVDMKRIQASIEHLLTAGEILEYRSGTYELV